MELSQLAALLAAALIAAVAAFQLALAAGAAYGEAVFGGKAPTESGVLTPPFRALAVVQAAVLLLLGWVLLARVEVVGFPLIGPNGLRAITWGILVFLVLNTAANLTAPHPIERFGMGSTTAVLSVLTLCIALSG